MRPAPEGDCPTPFLSLCLPCSLLPGPAEASHLSSLTPPLTPFQLRCLVSLLDCQLPRSGIRAMVNPVVLRDRSSFHPAGSGQKL